MLHDGIYVVGGDMMKRSGLGKVRACMMVCAYLGRKEGHASLGYTRYVMIGGTLDPVLGEQCRVVRICLNMIQGAASSAPTIILSCLVVH